jgi:hypothetical protein
MLTPYSFICSTNVQYVEDKMGRLSFGKYHLFPTPDDPNRPYVKGIGILHYRETVVGKASEIGDFRKMVRSLEQAGITVSREAM